MLPRSCRRRLFFEPLESRYALAAGFSEFVDPDQTIGDGFGFQIVPLSTGNVVITAPLANPGGVMEAGAMYLFNGRTGALISTLTGSHSGDRVGLGGVTALANGNFVVSSPQWTNGSAANAGAATWVNGVTGLTGVVGQANSLVGVKAGDRVGFIVTALSNGNYVVGSELWDNGSIVDAGAATFGDGTKGISGLISSANSLVGSTASDEVGSNVTALATGNYVLPSPNWDSGSVADAGALTFGSGTAGVSGTISFGNSLIGSHAQDYIGEGGLALPSGNYVMASANWDNGSVQNVGAVVLVNGNDGTGGKGVVSTSNALYGGTANDMISSFTIVPLKNGNFVVCSPAWHNGAASGAGAVTFVNETTGLTGAVSNTNSLVGTTAGDSVGEGGALALSNGNYVVPSPDWDNGPVVDAGAATWGSGTAGVHGGISASNSFVGSTASDQVSEGGVVALTNGDYVVRSSTWNNGAATSAGAATWGDGASGSHGTIGPANSLVGSSAGDQVSLDGIYALTNGNYVVCSREWSASATVTSVGAATFANGATGISGVINATNSLVGSTSGDEVGENGVGVLTNGNYVVISPDWSNNGAASAGAVTFGDGTHGVHGAVTAANSLVGTTAFSFVGFATGGGPSGVVPLTNGNYVVGSRSWQNGSVARAGAVTFGNGASGIHGPVTAANSLVGSTQDDRVGFGSIIALANGNYAIVSYDWDNGSIIDAGAATVGGGTSGIVGTINVANSAVGGTNNQEQISIVVDNVNQNIIATFPQDGRVRVGSQIDGFAHPWHLAAKPTDVNNDGHVAPNDVLEIINYINSGAPAAVAAGAQVGRPHGFLDVTGDDFVAADDALTVINAINAGQGGEGEAKGSGFGVQGSGGGDAGQETEDSGADEALMMLLAMDVNGQAGRRRIY